MTGKIQSYSLSVICPVYNEAGLLVDATDKILVFLRQHFAEFELLLIESGSTDGSADLCDRIAQTHAEVRVVHEGAKRGFGSAVRLGYRSARKSLVWLITADLPFDLVHVLTAIPLLSKCDCVLSYRSEDPRSAGRRALSFVYGLAVKALVGLRAKNPNSAFKVMKRDVISTLALESNGWLIDVELLYQIERRGISYREIPVPLIDRTAGASSITLKSVFKTGLELLRFSRALRS